MISLNSILLIASIHLLAVMAPGPDMFMAIRNSLVYSKKTGIFFAAGLALGVMVHFSYSLLGLNWLMTKSIVFFSIIKFLGAAYLIFIGYKSITNKKVATEQSDNESLPDLKISQSISLGFFTNLLNPKAVIYFLSLFTQFIKPNSALYVNLVYGIEIVLITFLWFCFVSTVLSQASIRNRFIKAQGFIEKLTGGILILFGLKIIASKNN